MPMTTEARTTKCQEARPFHDGKAHFDLNPLSAMHLRSVFQTLWPGVAKYQLLRKGLLRERGLSTHNIIANRIHKSVEHSRMLPEVFHSFPFPLCESVVPSH